MKAKSSSERWRAAAKQRVVTSQIRQCQITQQLSNNRIRIQELRNITSTLIIDSVRSKIEKHPNIKDEF